MIFIDNLFTSYKLLSILQACSISAYSTMRANWLSEHFKDKILDKNNSKILQ